MGGRSHGWWARGRLLGHGSTAAVYLAASTTPGEPQGYFAVKSAELSRSAPLRREHQVLSSLCSPHVVSCLGSDVTAEPDGRVLFNLFMDYVPGGDLSGVIKQHGRLDEHTIRVYTRGILDGLAYLHGRGIVHCDVKGHNILVGEDGESVKLADFGCARWVDDGSNNDLGIVSGTPLYMAPEVARGEDQGPAADIWALGCTVIEMATGCPPWRDVADPVATIHRIAFSSDVPEFPCNVSDDARDFLRRCLSRDPRKRWSAEELKRHPFVNCSQEFPMDSVSDSKKSSPKSILDQAFFWDSSQDEDEEVEDKAGSGWHLEKQPIESAQERLRQLVSSGFPLLRPQAANATWEESCWITIRNSEDWESPSEDDKTPTSTGSWWVEPASDASDRTRSAGYRESTAVVSTWGYRPSNPSTHSTITDFNNATCSSIVVHVGEGNDIVETHMFPRHVGKHEMLSCDHEHDTRCDVLLSQETKPYIWFCSYDCVFPPCFHDLAEVDKKRAGRLVTRFVLSSVVHITV